MFNLTMEYILRNINKNGTKTRQQNDTYTDDIMVVTKQRAIIEDILKELVVEQTLFGN